MAIPLDHCDSCREAIRWVKTEKGANMPLDPDPAIDGNVVFLAPDRDEGPVHVMSRAEVEAPPDRFRYKAHFVTCPHARRWSRGGAQRARQRALDRLERR